MKEKIAIILGFFVGSVFLISAYSKLIAPGIVEIILIDHGIVTSREVAAALVRILIGLEFSLGLLFFQPGYIKRIVLPASLIFLLGFTAYLSYVEFIVGDTQNCGCFGTMIEMSPIESIIKNILLILVVVMICKFSGADKKKIIWPVIAVVLPVVFVFLYSPVKSESDFKFAAYTNFESKGRVDLSAGNKLLAIFNTECDHCQEAAKEIALLYGNKKTHPEFYTLMFSEGNISVDSFKTVTGFKFPYHMIDARTFFDLIGMSPPRIYWLENGLVKETWDDDFVKRIEHIH